MKRVKVHTIVTFFNSSDVVHPRKIEDALAIQADDASFVQFKEALILIDDY